MEGRRLKLRHGTGTASFGKWLTDYLEGIPKYEDYLVYYDHGDSQESNVVAIKGFCGKSVTNQNRLADIDIMVANSKKEIVVLIEIEEKPASPKKYIGTIFAALMCNRFAVRVENRQHYFTIVPDSRFIIAGTLPTEYRLGKLNSLIGQRVRQFKTPSDSLDTRNITFEFTQDIKCTLEVLRKKMKKLFL